MASAGDIEGAVVCVYHRLLVQHDVGAALLHDLLYDRLQRLGHHLLRHRAGLLNLGGSALRILFDVLRTLALKSVFLLLALASAARIATC